MKILTFNINGIRASKQPVKKILDSLDADIVCLQETKVTRDMLDEPTAIVDGYNAYFSFSRKKTGYSGTVTFCRDTATPLSAEEGLSDALNSHLEDVVGSYGNHEEFGAEELQRLDGEGRAVMTQHEIELVDGSLKRLTIINVYVPRAAEREDRWTYKLRFLALLQSRAEALLQQGGHVIVLGDINTTHKRIDHCDPTTQEFLRADSRQWINQFLREADRDPELPPLENRMTFEAVTSEVEGGHFVDAYRFFHPDQAEAYTNWSTVTSARQTNYGKRLDYVFVDKELALHMVDCIIRPEIEGSDHCPVVVELNCHPVRSRKCPALCTRYMPEFQGRQQKLLSFFSRTGQKYSEGQRSTSKSPKDCHSGLVKVQCVSDKADLKLVGQDSHSDKNMSGKRALIHADLLEHEHIVKTVRCNADLPSLSARLHESVAGDLLSASKLDEGKGSLKRLSELPSASNSGKRKKSSKEDKTVGFRNATCKQASLLNFFQKPKCSSRASADSTNSHEDVTVKRTQEQEQTDKETDRDLLESSASVAQDDEKFAQDDGEPNSSPHDSQPSEPSSQEPVCTLLDLQQEFSPELACETQCTAPRHSPGDLWKGLLSGPPKPPLCKGHKEPCILRTVKKPGPNKGKQFYVCARPEGHSNNKDARCDHFQWIAHTSKKASQ